MSTSPVPRPQYSVTSHLSALTTSTHNYDINNRILLSREKISAKLALGYTFTAFGLVSLAALYTIYKILTGTTPVLASAFIVLIFSIMYMVLAGALEQLFLNEFLERHLAARYTDKVCWEIVTKHEGIALFHASVLYTNHPLAAPTVAAYLESRGVTEKDREVTSTLIADGTSLNLGQLVDVAVSVR
jgi:hypothetical protein